MKGGLRISRKKKQDGEIKEHRDCHGNVVWAVVCWRSGHIKELCAIHKKEGV